MKSEDSRFIGSSPRVTLLSLCSVLSFTGCATIRGWAAEGPPVTAQMITNAQDLRAGVDRRCLSPETLGRNERVAVVSYKVGGIPHYLAVRAEDYPQIAPHARYTIRPGSCELEPAGRDVGA